MSIAALILPATIAAFAGRAFSGPIDAVGMAFDNVWDIDGDGDRSNDAKILAAIGAGIVVIGLVYAVRRGGR